MGMDAVEILLRVEESFGITIPDSDAAILNTPGELADYVLRHMHRQGEPACLSSAAFYRLRRALIAATGVDRNAIRPETTLRSLLPRKTRRVQWQAIEGQLAMKLPELTYSRLALFTGVFLTALISFCSYVILATHMPQGFHDFFLLPAVSAGALYSWSSYA